VLNNTAWSAITNNTNTLRRRRQGTLTSGLITLGQARLFFSTSCQRKADRNKTSSSPGLSYCVSQRLAACNALFNTSSTTFTSWILRSTQTTFAVVDTTFAGYIVLSISRVFGIPPNNIVGLAGIMTGLSPYNQSLIRK
jgi:hypothetical protein